MAILNPTPHAALKLKCKMHGAPLTIYFGAAPYIPREAAERRIAEFTETHKRIHPECLETWIEEEPCG